MTVWWIGDAVLALVVVPIVVYLLIGVLGAATSIVPAVQRIAAAAHAGSADLDAVPLLLRTQDQAQRTIAAVAHYGGSLDVVLDDLVPRAVQTAGVADVNVDVVEEES
jgi:hypothetical protein